MNAPQDIKLILHPGYPKCGSSAIQSLLYGNARLLRQQGIYLPNYQLDFSFMPLAYQVGRLKQTGHRAKAWIAGHNNNPLFQVPISYLEGVIDHQAYVPLERKLKAIVAAARQTHCHTLLLSAENLAGTIDRVERLHQVLAQCFASVHIIFYFRRQDDWMLSSWQQWLYKQGWHLETAIQHWLENDLPNYASLIKLFETTYHNLLIEAVPLHKRALQAGDLLSDFCTRAGIDTSQFDFSQVYNNQSLNPFLCQAIATINAHQPQDFHDNSFRNLLDQRLNANSPVFVNCRDFLSWQRRSHILQRFESENRYLLDRFCPSLTYEDFTYLPTTPPAAGAVAVGYDDSEISDLAIIQTDLIRVLLQHQRRQSQLIYGALALASLSLLLWVGQVIRHLMG